MDRKASSSSPSRFCRKPHWSNGWILKKKRKHKRLFCICCITQFLIVHVVIHLLNKWGVQFLSALKATFVIKIAGSVAELYYTSCSRHWPGPWHCLDLTWLAVYCILHQSTDNLLIHTPRLPIYKQRPFRKPICNRISDDGTMRIKMISREDTAWVVVNFSVQWMNHSQMEKKSMNNT